MVGKAYTVSEVIDSFGASRQVLLFALQAFALLFVGYDFMIVTSTRLYVAQTFWSASPNASVLVGSLTVWGSLGLAVGVLLGGILADGIGRKKNLVCAWTLCALVVVACAGLMAPDSFGLCVALTALFAFAVRYTVASASILVPELYPTALRGTGVSLYCTEATLLGSLGTVALSWPAAALVTSAGVTDWSSAFLAALVPIVFGLVITLVAMRRSGTSAPLEEVEGSLRVE